MEESDAKLRILSDAAGEDNDSVDAQGIAVIVFINLFPYLLLVTDSC